MTKRKREGSARTISSDVGWEECRAAVEIDVPSIVKLALEAMAGLPGGTCNFLLPL
jgi:hypothetical protein